MTETHKHTLNVGGGVQVLTTERNGALTKKNLSFSGKNFQKNYLLLENLMREQAFYHSKKMTLKFY